MLALLLGGGVVYLVLGDLKEALILLAFATLSIVITVVQETRTERVLEALRDLTSPRALVIRDGERKRIAGREVVRGDLVVLAEGDRVPADAVLLAASDLQADESLLTGESVPVRKVACRRSPRRYRSGRAATTCRSSFPVRWWCAAPGLAEVTATGARSEIGKIGQSLARSKPSRRACRRRRGGWCGCSRLVGGGGQRARGAALRHLARRLARRACWPALRSACRCCRRSFRSC